MTAVLVWMRDGESVGSMITHAGSAIPGGWRVTRIDDGSVIVQKGSQTRTLLLSSGGTSSHQISRPGSTGSTGSTEAGFNLSAPAGNPSGPVPGATGASLPGAMRMP